MTVNRLKSIFPRVGVKELRAELTAKLRLIKTTPTEEQLLALFKDMPDTIFEVISMTYHKLNRRPLKPIHFVIKGDYIQTIVKENKEAYHLRLEQQEEEYQAYKDAIKEQIRKKQLNQNIKETK